MSFWQTDETHDPAARTWVDGAHAHAEFPVQNLPLGLFSDGESGPRAGIAIGAFILDLAGAIDQGLLPTLDELADCTRDRLNELIALGSGPRRAMRRAVFALLTDPAMAPRAAPFLVPADRAQLHLPCEVGDYTDFYAGIHHAMRIGRQFRPDNPLLPNYRHIPIGYHGRASSITLTGTPVRRPSGQLPGENGPRFGPTARLDLELELGVWMGPGNSLGSPVPLAEAHEHVAGFCLLNDWSARDIQAWEYQPLGPFLAKNFHTTVSPWIISPEALAPFRCPAMPRSEADPEPLPYLKAADDRAHGGLDLDLSVSLQSRRMRDEGLPPVVIARSSARDLWWTVQQMVAHHTVGGCNLRPGDLFGTGTISGEARDAAGSLVELTLGGREPLTLPSGEQRAFLEAGDQLAIHATASRPGFAPLGFGPCVGEVLD